MEHFSRDKNNFASLKSHMAVMIGSVKCLRRVTLINIITDF
jgi:hypothetical protein